MILKSFNKNNKKYYNSINKYYSTNNNNNFKNDITTKEIREKFLNYFETNKHKRLPSSSLIPHNDSTLLFTNAGMVQFKNQFTGLEESKYKLVTTSQKCVRAGGKHNDLENVGYTARHHTFFEMLGNFSFGGYNHFKRDSIQHAWNLLTKDFGLPKERLAISVLEGDEESASIWRDQIGLSNDKIMYLGKKDNFWSMGDGPGPCGPCSEIFWDHGEGKEVDGERFLEIWNLVFMQYNRNEKGELEKLAMPCVDTGMGLERMATVLQGKTTNYDIDLFQNLINSFKEQVMIDPTKASHIIKQDPQRVEVAYRVIIDHLRSISFLISDGVIPFNIGRGYVLRKIIRRALSYGKLLGFEGPFLYQLFSILEHEMADTFPQLRERSNEIKNVLLNEETTFYKAIKRGIPYLEEMIDRGQLNEDNLFLLYNTYGLPLEISEVKAKQNNIEIDMEKVANLVDETRNQSRATWKSNESQPNTNNPLDEVKKWKNDNISPKFIGYETTLNDESLITKSFFDNDNHLVYLSFDKSPFYGKSGGQIGDTGIIKSKNSNQIYNVIDTIKPYDNSLVLVVKWDPTKQLITNVQDDLAEGSIVSSQVEKSVRKQTAIHHSATHLLHAALREIIGKSVVQAGSFVGPNILRFDFTHGKKLSVKEIDQIEKWVNDVIDQDIYLETHEMPYSEASKGDAIQLFSEKYTDLVRVVSIPGFSKELCGGTHVERSSDIHHFKIISESSVAAGTRRIEAIAGKVATEWFKSHYKMVQSISDNINVPLTNFQPSIERLVSSNKQKEKEIEELNLKIALLSASSHSGHICGVECGSGIDHPLSIHVVDCDDSKILNVIAGSFSKSNPNHINITVSKKGKAICNLGANQEPNSLKTTADTIVKKLLSSLNCGGKGGGSKILANATIPLFNENILSSILKWGNCNKKLNN
ncbi:hypothetical protein DICPUDRAFT_153802 [Dictyostelium purpureum]|uniref:Alanine--tRNA ligase n=1 Tax=Dictyostelium purpureum TaxID=5786 RepID=F0ZPS7_DICPU|nr:uncharacterized protein DICPUDRAFT_153802 [Dictyostelium purpureum]EGC34051.1 hypothetical protein DICPUDRAFT_153802 [Dictyostelium purpureum]|eukprot:XP_003289415.1 hypothetical protein DICPUDRAFT_153802 [Dictyostelium purpureum]